jgi:long-chain acyl-CoA synthetase
MAFTHIAEMILSRGRENPAAAAFRVRQGDAFVDVPWSAVLPRIRNIAAGMLSSGPLSDGACVSIIGNTSMDWVLLDTATMSVGLRPVPIYASLLPEEVGYMHADTGVELIIAENAAQLEKVRAMRSGFRFFDVDYGPEAIRAKGKVVVVDPTGLEAADDWESLAVLEARGKAQADALQGEMDRRTALIRRSDVATYTYTSGTTGPPKAVIQTHENMLSIIENVESLNLFGDACRESGLFLFLPLAHSFGRFIEFCAPYFRSPLVLSTIPTLAQDLGLARPGFFPGAPRVYEKMMAKIVTAVDGAPPIRQKLFHWAVGVGRETIPYVCEGRPLPAWLGFRHGLADKIVLSKLRGRLGMDRTAILLSGSAPLRRDVHEFFLAIGLVLVEAYGLTETCPGLTGNRPGALRIGTVGQIFNGVQLKIGPDGEVLAKAPNITSGYLNRPEATADAFDSDGWFHTGDLGSLDADGYLSITGRKKELLKTSGGKYIAPIKIEARLKGLPIVQEAMVIGDNRNFCTAIFSLDPETLAEWAKRTGAPAEPNAPAVVEELKRHVASVNEGLASFESIKYFRITPGPMTVDGGELTASLKVKRKVVAEKYASLIEEMYA